jgi:hypothetical protein
MDESALRRAPHPLTGPRAEPLFLFGHAKRLLQKTEFPTVKKFLEVVIHILSDIPLETLMATFHQWMERLKAYIDDHGEHVE